MVRRARTLAVLTAFICSLLLTAHAGATAPATVVWDGRPDAGGSSSDAHWSTATNWVGDAIPHAGDRLVFPSSGYQQTNVNDFPVGTVFASFAVGSSTGLSQYYVSGAGITLAGDLVGEGSNIVTLPITLANDVTISSGYELFLRGGLNLNGHQVSVVGSGSAGLDSVTGSAPSPAISVTMSSGTLSGSGTFTGGTFLTSGFMNMQQGPWPGPVTMSGGQFLALNLTGTLTATGGTVLRLVIASALTLGPGATLQGFDTHVNGPIDLGGSHFTPTLYGPSTQTIIYNDGPYSVAGSFGNTDANDGIAAGDGYLKVSYDRSSGGDVVGTWGTAPRPPPPPPSPQPRQGYWMVGRTGDVYAFGDATDYSSNRTTGAVDLEPIPDGRGYWVVNAAGQVFSFGNAAYHGGSPALRSGESVTALSRTSDGGGYWLFTTLGRVLSYGNATFLGDMSATRLNGPVLDSIPTPSGQGYYMVAADGGIFTFGDASFAGSMGGTHLNQPVQSLVPDPDGAGYWLVASDGGIFAFDASFYGSMGGTKLNKPVTGMVGFGNGYLMVAEDGGIFTFGQAPFKGSLGANPPAEPIVSTAVLNQA
jgi:hypothetical protein